MDVRHGANLTVWEIRHSLSGRVRLYHPALHRRKQVCTALELAATGIPGIQSCRGNPRTGTIVVYYTPSAFREDQILESLDSALAHIAIPGVPGISDKTLPLCAVVVPAAAAAQFAMPILLPIAAAAVACAAFASFQRARSLARERRLGAAACEPVVVAGCLATGAVFPASVVCLGAEMSRSLSRKLRDQITRSAPNAISDLELQDIARDLDARLARGQMLIVIPGILCAAGTLTLGFGLMASLLIGGAGSVIVLADLIVPLKRLAEKQLEREMLEDLRGMYCLEAAGELDYGTTRSESFEVVGGAG